MNLLNRACLLGGLSFGIATSQLCQAGGLFLYEIATPDAGLAAAGMAARAQDAATAQSNPAGMTLLGDNQLLVGGQLLIADVGFDSQAGTNTGGNNGDNPITPTPAASAFYVHHINDKLAAGLAFYGNFGLVLDYDSYWVGRYRVQEAGLVGITLSPSLAYQLSPTVSAGLGLNLMYANFNLKTALNTPLDTGDGQLKFKDSDTGLGGNASLMFSPQAGTRLGLLYSSEIKLSFEDTPDFSNLGVLGNTLVNRRLLDSRLDLDMTVPQSLMLSSFQQLDSEWAMLGSLGWQDWSEFGRMGVQLDALNSHSLEVDRHYQDTWHASIGGQYQFDRHWQLSSGIGFDSSMVEDKYRTPDMPVGATWRWGLGASYELNGNSRLNLSYTLNWSGDMKINQQGGPLSGNLEGEYRNTTLHFFGLSYQQAF